jgi:3-oxoacyl-[acyl-carrier-protein] synthase-3
MRESAEHLVGYDPVPSVLIGHQANGRIVEQLRNYLAHLDVYYVNRISNSGNTSSASIPLAFADELSAGSVPARGRLGAIAYGAGETWGGISVSYQTPAAR